MNAAPPTQTLKGRVVKLQPGRNKSFFGFIQVPDGERFFFHADDVAPKDKSAVRNSSPVRFDVMPGERLPGEQYRRAVNVQVLVAQAA